MCLSLCFQIIKVAHQWLSQTFWQIMAVIETPFCLNCVSSYRTQQIYSHNKWLLFVVLQQNVSLFQPAWNTRAPFRGQSESHYHDKFCIYTDDPPSPMNASGVASFDSQQPLLTCFHGEMDPLDLSPVPPLYDGCLLASWRQSRFALARLRGVSAVRHSVTQANRWIVACFIPNCH